MEDISLGIRKFRKELGWNENTEFKFNKTNKKYVKELLQRIMIFDFRIRAICNDDLIQLADLCAGSIFRSYRKEKSDCMDYKNILLPRIEDVWDFG